jgi:carboxyl-terminal processing protease
MNEGSASASEIVAGALAQNDRAVIAGRRSFGKGSVQTIFNLGEDTALKLTIAEYKPAGTESIQLVGITPDIELVPATVDADAMNIVKDKPVSELDLETRMEKRKDRHREDVESLLRVSYLKPKEDKKVLEERSRKEYLKKPDISGDFPVEFARRLIEQAGSPSRKKMLKESEGIINEVQAEQQRAIDKALASLGINWSKAKARGNPKLSLSYYLTRGGKRIKTARAGDKVRLELVATNRGTGPYYRLIGVGESESMFLDGREFPFGRIEPGRRKKFSTPLELPESLPTQEISMDLTFKEANGIIPEPVKVVVPVKEIPHPAFAFNMRLPAQAKGKPFPTTGRQIPLIVNIKNSGKSASSEETVATISNECGEKFFIEKGRAKLGTLAPRASRRAQFSFHINGRPEDECAIKLLITDLKHLKVLSKKVDLNLETGTLKPPAEKTYGEPLIEVNAFPGSTSKSTVILTGTIKDTDPIRDFYVFVGTKKIAYVPNTEAMKTMPFKVAVPLEEGTNRIAIGARDIQDITNLRYLVIERTGAGPTAGPDTASHIPSFMP